MAVALPPSTPTHVDEVPGMLRVLVREIAGHGELYLLSTSVIAMGYQPRPIKAKIPVANSKAYQIIYMAFCGKIFDWVPVPTRTIQYQNLFNFETNVTYKVFMDIVTTLKTDVGLPEVSCIGTCRMSPLCDRNQFYVQTKPAYVDTVSYVIHLSFNNKKARNEIQPVDDIELGGVYIFTNGVECYRVELLKKTLAPQSASIVTHQNELSITHHPKWRITYKPELTITQQPKWTFARQPESTVARQPESTVARQPESTVARQPESTVARQPESTVARQPESTVARQPESTVARQPESTVARQPESTVEKQPESTVEKQPESAPKRFKHEFDTDHSTCRDAFCASKTRRKSNDNSRGVIRFATRDGRVETCDKRTCELIDSSVKKRKEEKGNAKGETVQRSDRVTSGKVHGKKVLVSRVDFGGPPIKVNRRDLYSVESICPALAKLPALAIPVEFGFIFGSDQNIEVAAEVLRNTQASLCIRTVFGGSQNLLPMVDVISQPGIIPRLVMSISSKGRISYVYKTQALHPAIPVPRMSSKVPVEIGFFNDRGEIYFDAAKDASPSTPLPEYVKLPLPNDETFTLMDMTLAGKMKLDWPPIKGETLEYNVFRDADEKNVTYDLYKKIVGTLDKAIGLPKVDETGTCRISPIYEGGKLYVQPQPEYVDSISYAIYMAFEDGKLTDAAPDVVIGEMYILANGHRNCRVRLLKTISSSPEPSSSEELGESRVSPERERTISTRCGPVGEYENGRVGNDNVNGNGGDDLNVSNGRSKDTSCGSGEQSEEDPEWEQLKWTKEESQWELLKMSEVGSFHGVYGEKVKVFRIDYGGEPITVYRAHLYNVESVCPKLKTLEDLAIQVNVQSINDSDVDKDARLEDLRNRKQIINIKTVSEAIGDTPALVNIFHEQNLE